MPTAEDLRVISEGLKEKLGRLPTITEITRELDGKSSTNFARVKRILTEGTDYAKPLTKLEAARLGGKPIPDHVVMADDIEGLKELQKKINKLNRVNKLSDKAIEFKIYKTQAGNFSPGLLYSIGNIRKFGSIDKLKNEFNKYKKTNEFQAYSKNEAMLGAGKKSALKQIDPNKLKIFNYLLLNEKASLVDLSKDLDIKTSQAKNLLQSLYTDIYKRVGDQGAVALKQYNNSELEIVHNAIKNTGVRLKDRVKNLVTDAYKGDKNLKPLLQRLDNFYTIQSELKKTPYGKFFAANLDHPVPLNFIRQVNEGADPINLIRVRPIPEFLNQRAFKAQFDRALGTAYKTGNKKALEAIVRAQSYLPEEFGGVTAEGKITNFGAKPFSLKTDLRTTSFPEIYDRVFKFINEPDLQTTFKDAKVSFKSLASQEKNIRNLASTFPSQIKKLVGNLTEQEKITYCSLLSRGGLPGDCAAAIDNDPVKASKVFAEAPATSSAMTKVKNAALGFLKSPNVRTFGIAGAAGALGAALVKEFRNDDPTTYLSNEEQQKNMLIDMVTGQLDDTPQESPAILDYQLPVLGAGAVAGTAAVAPSTIEAARSGALGATKSGITKTALKTLGRGLTALGTPAALLATEPLYIAGQVQQGDSLTDIATNPMNYLGAAFMGPATEFATKGVSPMIAKTMRLGISPSVLKTVSRRFGLPGLALSAGISGYELFDDYRNKRGMFSNEE